MRTLSLGAVALLAQAGCAVAGARAAPDAREIAVVAATSPPRVSVAREDSLSDVVTLWVGALLYPPFAADAAQGTVQLVGDVRRAQALRTYAGPELHGQLADAVVSAAAGGARRIGAEPRDDEGCGVGAGPAVAAETLHVAVTSVAWVSAPGPDAPLDLSLAVRGVLRGPQGSCAERTLLVSSGRERPLETWRSGEPHELEAELRARIAEAGRRIVAELIDARDARD